MNSKTRAEMLSDVFVYAMGEKLSVVQDMKNLQIASICEELREVTLPLVKLYSEYPKIARDIANKLNDTHRKGIYMREGIIENQGWVISSSGYDKNFCISIDVKVPQSRAYFYISRDYKDGEYVYNVTFHSDNEYSDIPIVLKRWENGLNKTIEEYFFKAYQEALDL